MQGSYHLFSRGRPGGSAELSACAVKNFDASAAVGPSEGPPEARLQAFAPHPWPRVVSHSSCWKMALRRAVHSLATGGNELQH